MMVVDLSEGPREDVEMLVVSMMKQRTLHTSLYSPGGPEDISLTKAIRNTLMKRTLASFEEFHGNFSYEPELIGGDAAMGLGSLSSADNRIPECQRPGGNS